MTENESSMVRSVKVPKLVCDKNGYGPWWEMMQAYASIQGYDDVMLGKVEIPKATVDESSLTSAQRKALRMNKKGYMDFILAVDTTKAGGRTVFNIIKGTKSPEYPDGNVYEAAEKLKDKFEPKTAPTMTRLSGIYQNSRLKKGKDPEAYITYLEDLRLRLDDMGWPITDDQFMVKILNSLTSEYTNQMEYLERELDKTGDEKLTIKKIRSELSLRYERITKNAQKSDNGYKGETALFAGGFKGRCHNCGKYGHKSVDCRDKNNSGGGGGDTGGGGFQGKCYKCHKKGHKARDCMKGKNNESGDSGEIAEVALTVWDFGDDLSVELAENVTVGNIGEFGDSEIPNDFFDDWAHIGPESDDDSYEQEFALVAFDGSGNGSVSSKPEDDLDVKIKPVEFDEKLERTLGTKEDEESSTVLIDKPMECVSESVVSEQEGTRNMNKNESAALVEFEKGLEWTSGNK